MAVAGAIADAARRVLPVTWDALSRDDRFGDALLQQSIDVVKEDLFGQVVNVSAEDDYPLKVIRHAGLMVALDIIPSGVDMWMNELIEETARGTDETHSFADRARQLQELGKQIALRVKQDEDDILALLGRPNVRNIPRMGISTPADDVLLTPNPREWGIPFKARTGTQRLI